MPSSCTALSRSSSAAAPSRTAKSGSVAATTLTSKTCWSRIATEISPTNTKVGDTPIRMVVMGEAYLQRDKTDKPNRFVCLLSDHAKVVLTFFTEQ